MRLHAAFIISREQYALQPLALVVVSACVFRFIAYACMQHNCFCLVFSKDFNIITALSAHQTPTLPQKFDSLEGLFGCKKGVAG